MRALIDIAQIAQNYKVVYKKTPSPLNESDEVFAKLIPKPLSFYLLDIQLDAEAPFVSSMCYVKGKITEECRDEIKSKHISCNHLKPLTFGVSE